MDNIEEIRQKELETQKKQLFAQRVTAAASVASAVAAHKQAAATEEIRQQIAADSEREAKHQIRLAAYQREIADDQRLTNFRTTVLATLLLLKDEEEKKQYLTEQLQPQLKDEIDVPKLSPIAVISLVANKVLKNYVGNVGGQDLRNFLSTGKDLLERTERWIEKCNAREKQVNEFQEAQGKLNNLERPFGFRDVVKIVLWAVLVCLVIICLLGALTDDTTMQQLSGFVYFNVVLLGGSTVLGAILHFWLKRRKIKKLKAKVRLLTPPDDLPLKKEREELGEKTKLQDEKWEVFRPQIVNYLMEIQPFKDIITGDPRAELLKYVTMVLERCVNDLQSFLPPSSRLPVGHYAQFFIDETDVQNFRDGQGTVENDLKTLLTPFFTEQTIVLRSQQTLDGAGQVKTEIESSTTDVKSQEAPIFSRNKSKQTIEEIVARHRAEIKDSKIWFAPNIPENKLLGAVRSYAQTVTLSEALMLVDDTVWGGCANGLLITRDKLYAHNLLEPPKEISISQVKTVNIGSDKSSATKLFINGSKFAALILIDKCNHIKICQLVTDIVLANEDKTTDDEPTAPPVTSIISQKKQQLHDEAQTQIAQEKFERREAERATQPKLSGPLKFANFLLAAFCGLLTFVIILGMIGVLLDQSDTDETAVGKISVILVLCVPAFLFGWITYKCVSASQR